LEVEVCFLKAEVWISKSRDLGSGPLREGKIPGRIHRSLCAFGGWRGLRKLARSLFKKMKCRHISSFKKKNSQLPTFGLVLRCGVALVFVRMPFQGGSFVCFLDLTWLCGRLDAYQTRESARATHSIDFAASVLGDVNTYHSHAYIWTFRNTPSALGLEAGRFISLTSLGLGCGMVRQGAAG
jgi:hypothetical protein